MIRRFAYHLLDITPLEFPPLVLVNIAITVPIKLMLWLNIIIIDTIGHLNSLQQILHLLLRHVSS